MERVTHPPSSTADAAPAAEGPANPWPALWALIVGFFMILVDVSIVSIATPALMTDFGAPIEDVLWVTSAYLLAYAVPLLITGRLGDLLGPKKLYLAGLATFTVSSLACGLADSIEALVAARVVQGLGAAMMTPHDRLREARNSRLVSVRVLRSKRCSRYS